MKNYTKLILRSYFSNNLNLRTYAFFIFNFLLKFRFLKIKIYVYMFFYKRPLFFLEFVRFRFKKIKRFRLLKFNFLKKRLNFKSRLKTIVFSKKNQSNLSLKKNLLKKSLYNNKYFNSRFFNKKKLFFLKKRKKFKKKALQSLNKFFIKYIASKRQFLLKFFNLKNKNQTATTRQLLSLNKLNTLNFKLFLELSLVNVLIRSKFCLSKSHAFTLINLNVVYVNNKLIKRFQNILKKNDVISVTFSKSFFFFYKYNYNLVFKRLSKLNYCVWRIQSSKKRKNKQPIRSFPRWLNSIFFFPYPIPSYIEVDFVSLTSIILKNPKSTIEFSPFIYWHFNYFLYKTTNWKWIT